jgi:hypothetical protein
LYPCTIRIQGKHKTRASKLPLNMRWITGNIENLLFDINSLLVVDKDLDSVKEAEDKQDTTSVGNSDTGGREGREGGGGGEGGGGRGSVTSKYCHFSTVTSLTNLKSVSSNVSLDEKQETGSLKGKISQRTRKLLFLNQIAF